MTANGQPLARVFVSDAVDRLTSVTGGAHESYSYDEVGNRVGNDAGYSFGAFNRLTGRDSISYTYDANGNQLSSQFQTSGTTFSYDFENRLTQATMSGFLYLHPQTFTVTYKYDALGRRIERTAADGDVARFVYDGQNVIEDLDNSGGVINSYLNGPRIDDIIRRTDDANGNLYFIKDHLGSTTALTDSNGNFVQSIAYDPFGNSTGSALTRYTYTGREFDSDTGLYYYRARSYDPQAGRFISEDPIGFLGGDRDLYVFVNNDPILFRDPLGMRRCNPIIGGIVGGIIGGVVGAAGGGVLGGLAGAGVGCIAGAVGIGGFGTVTAGPGGTVLGGGIGCAAGAGLGVGPGAGLGVYVGSAIGVGVGIGAGINYCSKEEPCEKTDDRPWSPNNRDKDDECFEQCGHLLGIPGDYGNQYRKCYRECKGTL